MGSGAGGSIQIHAGIFEGSGNIEANGQDGEGHGGYGGGGRVLINYTYWYL